MTQQAAAMQTYNNELVKCKWTGADPETDPLSAAVVLVSVLVNANVRLSVDVTDNDTD